MAENRDILLQLAEQIRDERRQGANTANRIGGMFLSIIEAMQSGAFLRKDIEDVTAFLLTMSQGAHFGDFIPGMNGKGAAIDAQGNAELQSLSLRSFLKVPSLAYNKISVTGGETWNTDGGTICKVTAESLSAYWLEMNIEQGDTLTLQVDDICKGHYNQSGGFITSYFRVTHVDTAAARMRIILGADSEVPAGENHPPCQFMNVARYGSFTIRERQRSQYFSSSGGYIALLDGVDNYKIEKHHYRGVLGAMPGGLLPDSLPISCADTSIYLQNVVASNFFQVDSSGNTIKTIRDRGLWNAAPDEPYLSDSRFQDEVWHQSCKYRCIVSGTTAEPAYNSPNWLLVAGDTTLRVDIESTSGETFLRGRLNTTLVVSVRRGVNDITDSIAPLDFSWTRQSGNTISDTVWNSEHRDCARSVAITDTDVPGFSAIFTCTVYVADGAETLQISYQI